MKAGWAFTRYNNEPMQDFWAENGCVGGCYAVGVYSALFGTPLFSAAVSSAVSTHVSAIFFSFLM